MKLSAILEPLIAAGVPGDVILATVRAFEEQSESAIEKRRESDRKRQADRRARHVTSRDVTVTPRDTPRPEVPSPQTPYPPTPRSAPKGASLPPTSRAGEPPTAERLRFEFDTQFWPSYGNQVSRPKAQAAFIAARRRGHSLDTIVDGTLRYCREKPADRQWLNPATFLADERFLDGPTPAVSPSPRLVHSGQGPPVAETEEEWLARRKRERAEREKLQAAGP